MFFSQLILYPLSLLYGLVMLVRNKMFDLGILKQKTFPVPTICVGNITVGGTGKTPLVEFLVTNLKSRYRVAVLSRGYKRVTKGVIIASPSDSAQTIGDEAFQIYKKFPGITVVVAEERVEGMKQLMALPQPPDLVILDDAFQHRYLKPGLKILLVDHNRPIWKDTPFPGGRMREFACASRRADIVLVTKCPLDAPPMYVDTMVNKIKGASHENTFLSSFRYATPVNVHTGAGDTLFFCNNPQFVLLSGIASPAPLEAYLQEQGTLKKHFKFPDHHDFSIHDISQVEFYACENNLPIITTEKDAVKLRELNTSEWFKQNTYLLPITTTFIDDREKEFIYQIYKYLANA